MRMLSSAAIASTSRSVQRQKSTKNPAFEIFWTRWTNGKSQKTVSAQIERRNTKKSPWRDGTLEAAGRRLYTSADSTAPGLQPLAFLPAAAGERLQAVIQRRYYRCQDS